MSPDLELKSKRPQHLCASCGLSFVDRSERLPVCPACAVQARLAADADRFASYLTLASTAFRGRR
jgi:hypothetical protein